MKYMTEDRAKEICLATPVQLRDKGIPRKELVQADQWIRDYALNSLKAKIDKYPAPIKAFVSLCARAHFGSVETDTFLNQMGCYPKWMEERHDPE